MGETSKSDVGFGLNARCFFHRPLTMTRRAADGVTAPAGIIRLEMIRTLKEV
ncbi:MAG: hypothetical protein OJF48_001024 [Afipia sp.]|jgi:hypothetical protein|nr:MAG: hypothetical protein OJF48_001024 [Afipia sp.]